MKPTRAPRRAFTAGLWGIVFAFSLRPIHCSAQESIRSPSVKAGRISVESLPVLSRTMSVYWKDSFVPSAFSTNFQVGNVVAAIGVPVGMVSANPAVPAAAQGPGQVMRGCGLMPMNPNTAPTPGNGENPIFSEGKDHLADPRFKSMDEPQRQKYLGEWAGLHRWQETLVTEAKAIAADWKTAEGVVAELDGHGCRVKKIINDLEPAIAAWNAACSGTVDQRTYDSCITEQARLQPLIQERDRQFQEFKDAVDAYNRDVFNPAVAKSTAWAEKVGLWEGKVTDFNTRIIKALSNHRKADVKFVDYLVKKYKLDPCQRRFLHDLITKQGYDEEEIEFIAREIAQSGERRCPPGRGGIRD